MSKAFAWETFARDERQVDSLTHIRCQDLPATKRIRAVTPKKYHILFAPKKSKSLMRKKNERKGEGPLGFCHSVLKEVAQPRSWGCFSPQTTSQGLCKVAPPSLHKPSSHLAGTQCTDGKVLHCTALPFAKSKPSHRSRSEQGGKIKRITSNSPHLDSSTQQQLETSKEEVEEALEGGLYRLPCLLPTTSANRHSLAFTFPKRAVI